MPQRKFKLFILLILFLLTAPLIAYWPWVSTLFTEYDIFILKAVNSNRVKALDPFFIFITNTSSYIALGFIALVFILSVIQKSALLQRYGWQLLSFFIFAFVIIKSLKYSVGRIRPFESYSYLEKLVDISTPSFPSGHTLEAAAIATSIVLLFKSRILLIVAVIWSLTVALSRIVLGVHYPSDVIAGILIGILSACLCHWIFIKKLRHDRMD